MVAFWQVFFGLLTVLILGLCVGPLLKQVQKSTVLLPPNEATKEKWEELTEGNEGGWILGNLERILFFGAYWMNEPIVIAAWLAFKVASKWNAWSNVISLPKTLSGIDELDYLIARRRLGSQLLMTFQVGTLANIIIGLLGLVVSHHVYEFIQYLFG